MKKARDQAVVSKRRAKGDDGGVGLMAEENRGVAECWAGPSRGASGGRVGSGQGLETPLQQGNPAKST